MRTAWFGKERTELDVAIGVFAEEEARAEFCKEKKCFRSDMYLLSCRN